MAVTKQPMPRRKAPVPPKPAPRALGVLRRALPLPPGIAKQQLGLQSARSLAPGRDLVGGRETLGSMRAQFLSQIARQQAQRLRSAAQPAAVTRTVPPAPRAGLPTPPTPTPKTMPAAAPRAASVPYQPQMALRQASMLRSALAAQSQPRKRLPPIRRML